MREPWRALIAFDYCADGIWWISTKKEQGAKTYEEWSRLTRDHWPAGWVTHRPWGGLLSDQLLRDLKAWNDSWEDTIVQEDEEIVSDEVLEERGQELAIRVQNELGTDGWEVLYHLGGRVHRVYPPGSWPAETWRQDLLGYAAPDPQAVIAAMARVIEVRTVNRGDAGPCTPLRSERDERANLD